MPKWNLATGSIFDTKVTALFSFSQKSETVDHQYSSRRGRFHRPGTVKDGDAGLRPAVIAIVSALRAKDI